MPSSFSQKNANTSENWWPSPLAHIRDGDPWAENDVVVAEILSFHDTPHTEHRYSYSALVTLIDLEEIRKNFATLDHQIHAGGPRPYASPDHPYTPKFWMATEGSPRRSFEPLVLSRRSHDKTVLQLDPGFLMTYGLVPRGLGDDETRWDDPS